MAPVDCYQPICLLPIGLLLNYHQHALRNSKHITFCLAWWHHQLFSYYIEVGKRRLDSKAPVKLFDSQLPISAKVSLESGIRHPCGQGLFMPLDPCHKLGLTGSCQSSRSVIINAPWPGVSVADNVVVTVELRSWCQSSPRPHSNRSPWPYSSPEVRGTRKAPRLPIDCWAPNISFIRRISEWRRTSSTCKWPFQGGGKCTRLVWWNPACQLIIQLFGRWYALSRRTWVIKYLTILVFLPSFGIRWSWSIPVKWEFLYPYVIPMARILCNAQCIGSGAKITTAWTGPVHDLMPVISPAPLEKVSITKIVIHALENPLCPKVSVDTRYLRSGQMGGVGSRSVDCTVIE